MKLDHGIQGLASRLGAVMFALSLPAMAQFSFDNPVTYGVNGDPHDVAVGDIDADGDLDILTTLHSPPRVGFLRNDGNGNFSQLQFLALDPSAVPEGILAPDFDGDGLADIAILSVTTNRLLIEHNLGNGIFVNVSQIPLGAGPTEMAVVDMDADGDLDIAVSNRLSDTITILHNIGFTQFDPVQEVTLRAGPKVLAAGKFYGDALPGIAVAVHDAHSVYVLRNDGTGLFQVRDVLGCPGATNPECVDVADFDEDGDDDIVVAFSLGIANKFAVFYQLPGEPLFEPTFAFSAPFCHNVGAVHPAHIVAADFDLDTRIDVAIVSSGTAQLSFLQNQGNTVFGFQAMMNLPGPVSDHLALADFDRDFFADLVVTNDGGTSVSVVMNALTTAENYCLSVPNSTGVGARLGLVGSTSIAANSFALSVTDGPALKPGIFLYSVKPGMIPFSGSFLCLEQPILRLQPAMFLDGKGNVSYALPLVPEYPGHKPFAATPGEVVNFQFFYRDTRNWAWPRTNFTDGLRIVFTP